MIYSTIDTTTTTTTTHNVVNGSQTFKMSESKEHKNQIVVISSESQSGNIVTKLNKNKTEGTPPSSLDLRKKMYRDLFDLSNPDTK